MITVTLTIDDIHDLIYALSVANAEGQISNNVDEILSGKLRDALVEWENKNG